MKPHGAAIAVSWEPLAVPLSPVAVVGVGAAGEALARRLMQYGDEALAQLRGAATPDAIVVLGSESHLPWADGVVYLGREVTAPSLLVPTHLAPDVPLPLLEAAVMRAVQGSPVAVLPGPDRLIVVGAARAVDRTTLQAWRAAR